MLFITRKESESVVIMNEIEVQILKIDEDCVRIGVTAPPNVSVPRQSTRLFRGQILRSIFPATALLLAASPT